MKWMGIAVAAVALGAACWLHFGLKSRTVADVRVVPAPAEFPGHGAYAVPTQLVYLHRRALWQDPIAVLVLAVGIGTGVTLIHHERQPRRTTETRVRRRA